MVKESSVSRVTTVRFNDRMFENMEIIRADALINDGLVLSNSDCVRKAMELLRQRIESNNQRKEKSGVN